MAENESFGGHWQGSAAPGILVFSSTDHEVRFDVEDGFSLESLCWRTTGGAGGKDAEQARIDSDTHAVRVSSKPDTRLKQVMFDVNAPPEQAPIADAGQETQPEAQPGPATEEKPEQRVLGAAVARQGSLVVTGVDLLRLVGLDLLLLLFGGLLLCLRRSEKILTSAR